MSLRKSPTLTTALVAANRQNAPLSRGPSTAAGRENSQRNSRKHGLYARDGAEFRRSLQALGEDPAEFDQLYQDLLRAYRPADPLWARQVEDLARLYWRRGRLERARNALLRRQLEAVEKERERRIMEGERETHDTFDDAVTLNGMWRLPDSLAKFRVVVAHLETIQCMAETGQFDEPGQNLLRYLYGKHPTWRGGMIQRSYEALAKARASGSPLSDVTLANLRSDLAGELTDARKQCAWWQAQNAETSAATRDASLAPEGKQWALILREERDLDRAIDRKVKILLSLRRSGENSKFEPRAEEAGEVPSQDGPDKTAETAVAVAEK